VRRLIRTVARAAGGGEVKDSAEVSLEEAEAQIRAFPNITPQDADALIAVLRALVAQRQAYEIPKEIQP
jgi:hypothetical protein